MAGSGGTTAERGVKNFNAGALENSVISLAKKDNSYSINLNNPQAEGLKPGDLELSNLSETDNNSQQNVKTQSRKASK